MLRKIAFIIAGAGGLSFAALFPAPSEAASVHLSAGLAPTVESNVVSVWHHPCHRNHWIRNCYYPYLT
jgi:hypothetical protein